jgi:hypothetical protein
VLALFMTVSEGVCSMRYGAETPQSKVSFRDKANG